MSNDTMSLIPCSTVTAAPAGRVTAGGGGGGGGGGGVVEEGSSLGGLFGDGGGGGGALITPAGRRRSRKRRATEKDNPQLLFLSLEDINEIASSCSRDNIFCVDVTARQEPAYSLYVPSAEWVEALEGGYLSLTQPLSLPLLFFRNPRRHLTKIGGDRGREVETGGGGKQASRDSARTLYPPPSSLALREYVFRPPRKTQ